MQQRRQCTPLQCSCLENPMDGGAWWAAVHGVAKSWTWLSDFTFTFHFHFSLSCTGEGNDNPLQCSCLEHPRDGGAWWAAVCGVAQSRTPLKRLSSSSNACWVQVEEEISGSTSQARRTQTELCFSSLSFMCLAQCLEYKYWMDGKMDHPYS